MAENVNEFDKERASLLLFIWLKRKVIVIITAIAFVAAVIVSLCITPIFKSTAIIFPSATNTVSFSEFQNLKASPMDFGGEGQAEQLVQVLKSTILRNRIVDQFDLINHYDIDSTDIYKYYKLGKEWEDHVDFKRTRYGSIRIDVFDRDPELAAQIANRIVNLIDTVKNDMIRERTVPAFEIIQRKRKMIEAEKSSILSELDSLSKLGVVSIEVRATIFLAYGESKSSEDKAFLKDRMNVNVLYGSRYDALEKMRDVKINELSKFEEAYEQAESDANTNFSHKFIVEPAVVSDRKDTPKRVVIVLVATIAGFVFAVFALLVRERISELRKAT